MAYSTGKKMMRVNRFDAAIDMIAAGTSPPIPIAAKATPANQSGNERKMSAGTAKFDLYCANCGAKSGSLSTPAAIAMNPVRARRPRRKE
jgi:hypothetical protein